MTFRRSITALAALLVVFASTHARASADPIQSYDAFVKGADAQRGLFTIWHKDGKVYLELAAAQLERDFVQSIVPASGLGGHFIVWGNTDYLPTELIRFERAGNNVAIVWPAPYFIAPHTPAAARAIDRSFARSIAGLAAIAALDERSGALVIDAAPFLEDQLNLKSVFKENLPVAKGDPYVLNKERSYFGQTKAFPKNVLLEAMQDWTSDDERLGDVLPDPRHVQVRVAYNIAEPPSGDGYVPRFADDRVGIYDDVYLQYDNDRVLTRKLRYTVRWNLRASDPSKPLSPATHPMVFYLSDTIPEAYRPAIRAAVLKWNAAFERIGISGALEVRDQPADPDWDADDIRYNVLRWVTESEASFGADSQTLYDPRTGEEFRTGVLISADVPIGAQNDWTYFVDPVRYGRSSDPMPQGFLDDVWASVMLHETGHNLGMQHNFIGSRAYTARQLQDPRFTAANGVASTVMEYAPLNLWPKQYGQGSYVPTALGPYDYYAMHWAYAPVPGATSPQDEVATLGRWASAWSDPRYRYASDEDVSWNDGHAADPRVEQGVLSDDPLRWCAVQLQMDRGLWARLDDWFPAAGGEFESQTEAFSSIFERYAHCTMLPTHYIGGQYISRAHRGDPHAEPPIVPVPRSEQRRAFELLDRYLFASDAWQFAPSLLDRLGYSEWAGYADLPGYGNLPLWAYDPPQRHDLPVAEQIAKLQSGAIAQMLQPLVLQRLAADASLTHERDAMSLADLFDWIHASVYRELGAGASAGPIGPLRRALQADCTGALIALYQTPGAGTPEDAISLARAQLASLEVESARALRSAKLDDVTRAHLARQRARAHLALEQNRAVAPSELPDR